MRQAARMFGALQILVAASALPTVALGEPVSAQEIVEQQTRDISNFAGRFFEIPTRREIAFVIAWNAVLCGPIGLAALADTLEARFKRKKNSPSPGN